jgi:uncharacterized membrane protein
MSNGYNPTDVPPVPTEIPSTPPPPKKDNTLMLVLSYLYILFLVPLITEKNDPQVQWHAKHGMILTIAEAVLQFGLWIIGMILSNISGILGCVTCFLPTIIWVAFLVIRIMGIVKATKGERLIIPGLSQYVDSIKL